jgi:hypothetical protein
VALSPNHSRVATAKAIIAANVDRDIWITDISRPASTRVTFGPLLEDMPRGPLMRTLLFTIGGDNGNLFEQAVNGEAAPRLLLSKKSQHKIPTTTSPTGALCFTPR